jgi:hypothetical protein
MENITASFRVTRGKNLKKGLSGAMGPNDIGILAGLKLWIWGPLWAGLCKK